MDKQKFIQMMQTSTEKFDVHYINNIVEMTIGRIEKEEQHIQKFQTGVKLSMAIMEEAGELVQAISKRLRERTADEYEILEECADIIIDVLCAAKIFGISTIDLEKAIMVKCKRQEQKTKFD